MKSLNAELPNPVEKLDTQRKYKPTKSNIYNNTKWRQLSLHIRRRNPLCKICKDAGRITPSQCVDHIIRHRGLSDPLFWDKKNLQALCTSCHSKKTLKEEGSLERV